MLKVDLHLLLLHPAHGRPASRTRLAGSSVENEAVGAPQFRPAVAGPHRMARRSASLRPAPPALGV